MDTNTGTVTTALLAHNIFTRGCGVCFVTMTNSLTIKYGLVKWVNECFLQRELYLSTTFRFFIQITDNRTWDAIQSQDKKFTLHKAVFSTGSSTVSLQNNIIGVRNTNEEGSSTSVYGQKLLANPITISNGVTKVKVQHRDHGMYSTSNNVVITGVSSGVSTTIATTALTTTSSRLTLTSATNFPSSGTVTVKSQTRLCLELYLELRYQV